MVEAEPAKALVRSASSVPSPSTEPTKLDMLRGTTWRAATRIVVRGGLLRGCEIDVRGLVTRRQGVPVW